MQLIRSFDHDAIKRSASITAGRWQTKGQLHRRTAEGASPRNVSQSRGAFSRTSRARQLSGRIAKRAYDRVEDQIDSAPLPQAVVTAGVFTDKLQLLSGDVTSRLLSVNVHADAVDLVAQFNKLHDAIRAKAKAIEAQSEETEGRTGLPSSKET